MSAKVIPLHITMADVEAAWEEYDRAGTRMREVYSSATASRAERFEASMEAAQHWQEFLRLFGRLPPNARA